MLLVYVNWKLDPEIFSVFGLSVRYYGLLFFSGLLVSFYAIRYIFKKEGMPKESSDKLLTYGVIGVLVGARLGHCLFYQPDYFLSHPIEMFLPVKFIEGGVKFIGYKGLASHGGVLGLIVSLIMYSFKLKLSIFKTLDIVAIAAGLGAGFIRLANLMNSEIIGQPTNSSWGFIFERIDDVPRHPAQLYEALCYFVVFVIMYQIYRKNKKYLGTGLFFGLLIFLIFLIRFVIEFIKENQVSFEDNMIFNMGQILSIPYIAIGFGFIIFSNFKIRKLNAN